MTRAKIEDLYLELERRRKLTTARYTRVFYNDLSALIESLLKIPPAPPAGEDRFCVNCKHCAVHATGQHFCTSGMWPDVVTGLLHYGPQCDIRRFNAEDKCGPDGKLFEPKEQQ